MAQDYIRFDTGYSSNPKPEQDQSRPRTLSGDPAYRCDPATQPAISETIERNFHKSELPPEVIDEIANRVYQQLKSTHLDGQIPGTQHPPPPYNNLTASSPTSHSAPSPPMAPRNVYTPPSPHRFTDEASYGSPSNPNKFPTHPAHGSPPLATSIQERRTVSPPSQTNEASHKESRPKPPSRLSTSQEETTLEKIWGQLFDNGGRPTARLGQFLRGIAMHLIEDYEPTNSLVITPQKMQKFYQDTKLAKELYEWQDVFDDHTSSISRMYRDIEAQHHLVQDRFDQRPDIPGLTPHGFERWATLMIEAHPDAEYERLQKAVLAMPISNPDDKKERFPKELSRRLFPRVANLSTRDRLERAMTTHCGIRVPTPAPNPSPPFDQRPMSVPASAPSTVPASFASATNPIERERQPYSGNPSEASDDEPPVSQPIERERQPYSSQPGQGRIYDDSTPKPPQTARVRAESMAGRARPKSVNLGQQRQSSDYPPPDAGPFPRPSGTPTNPIPMPRNGRRRSPSMGMGGGDFRRSEGDVFSPGSYSNNNYTPNIAGDVIEDGRRYSDLPRDPRDPRTYEVPPRGTWSYNAPPRGQQAGYIPDDDYHRNGARPPGNGYDYNQQYPPSFR